MRDVDGTRWVGSTSLCPAEHWVAKLHRCFRAHEQAKALKEASNAEEGVRKLILTATFLCVLLQALRSRDTI